MTLSLPCCRAQTLSSPRRSGSRAETKATLPFSRNDVAAGRRRAPRKLVIRETIAETELPLQNCRRKPCYLQTR